MALALQAAVQDDPSQLARIGRTLVFASTVNAANEVAEVLASSGLQVVTYHRKTPVAVQVSTVQQSTGGPVFCG